MADEVKRWALAERLVEVLGDEPAMTLMEHLPPVDWHQLATKDDVRMAEERLRAEFAAQFGELRGEIRENRGETRENRGEFALQLARQTRTIVFTQLGVALTIWIALLVPGLG